MRPTVKFLIATTVLSLATTTLHAQGASIADQLRAQYKLTRVAVDSGGLAVTEPGTVLSVQKGGLLGVPPINAAVPPSKVEDGSVHPPGAFLAKMFKDSRFLNVGEKVYITKLEVNPDKDKITLMLIECDTCNNVNQPSSYKSSLVFQFPKGKLQSTSVPEIEDMIGQILSISEGGDQQGGGQGQGQGQDQGNGNNNGNNNNNGGNGGGQQQEQQTETQTIQLGQSIDQMKAALGAPAKIINLGAKQIYVYKDLKVTFNNGKVTDVQ